MRGEKGGLMWGFKGVHFKESNKYNVRNQKS